HHWAPLQFELVERAAHAGIEQFGEIIFKARQIDLRLRIAKARIELNHARAILRQNDSGIQDSAIINPFYHTTTHERLENLVVGLREFSIRQEWRGRIRAHSAGIQPLVTIQSAFMVLRSREKLRGFAVAKRVQRYFRSLKKFLDNNFRTRSAKRFPNENL